MCVNGHIQFHALCFKDEDEHFNILEFENDVTNAIQRRECNMTEADFVEKFVRKSIPVILTNCEGYQWVKKYDLSVDRVARLYHDNTTKTVKKWNKVPITGFTHTYTPNDHTTDDDEVMQYLASGAQWS